MGNPSKLLLGGNNLDSLLKTVYKKWQQATKERGTASNANEARYLNGYLAALEEILRILDPTNFSY